VEPGRPIRIAVIGAADATEAEYALAVELGRELASRGAVVVCGGRSGVMEGAARGCAENGGLVVGILPGIDPGGANQWVTIPLATGLGEARNAIVATAGEAVVVVGGSWGTLSEIAFAKKRGLSVGTLATSPVPGLDLPELGTPAHAAEWSVSEAMATRRAVRE
jgi:uncharacterized protein (TIGR00725 family)